MKEIIVNNSKNKILIDDEDFIRTNCHSWNVTCGRATVIISQIHDETMTIGRFILNNPSGYVDHKNHNIFDNQKENLRICTASQNMANQKIRKDNRSGYKGVKFFSPLNKWVARITKNKKLRHLGYFTSKEEAALAYNEAAIKLHGEFANLNIFEDKEAFIKSSMGET